MGTTGHLGVTRGTALYVGALMGPGVLLVPSLALDAAGPASIIAWAALLVLSAPLAITFAVLGVRHPVDGGVAVYVREGIGPAASAATGVCFLTAVLIGAPAVSLIGGYYVADLTGSGTPVAVAVAVALFGLALVANAGGLRVASAAQLVLASLLVLVIAVAVAATLPSHATEGWTPFAPHGWLAVGTAANVLVWLFIGWEAMAQMAGEFTDPGRDLPRAVGLAYAIVAVLYVGLAVATITVVPDPEAKVPLADLLGAGLGSAGRNGTVVLALVLTLGTMNVYVGGAARLAAALAREGALPAWLAGGRPDVPRRPLIVLAVVGGAALAALAAGAMDPDDLVRATSACFVVVYVLALGAAVRILDGRVRVAAAVALALMLVLAVFSAAFLLVPAVAVAVALGVRARRTGAAVRA
jgi:amino acid efflux transporter